ncbi:Transcription initiation factor TFIID subunit 7 [Tupaia chinensis]|uniref:Transcription initiation factor TFIID subunit 7 n=1 Tax=Tupaia chinensis TaxID=246437 RepID=L9L1R8_TUPCH|nr:Transcription initiation factor TFIID subunit 7 [Tupaia chinensis]
MKIKRYSDCEPLILSLQGQGHDSLEHDKLRKIFSDLSSSNEDEDETQHPDEENGNVTDTEEDVERPLQEKLKESE